MKTSEKIDRLIHDAEHAESGAEFARFMQKRDPGNPTHAQVEQRQTEKAKQLREQAAALAEGA